MPNILNTVCDRFLLTICTIIQSLAGYNKHTILYSAVSYELRFAQCYFAWCLLLKMCSVVAWRKDQLLHWMAVMVIFADIYVYFWHACFIRSKQCNQTIQYIYICRVLFYCLTRHKPSNCVIIVQNLEKINVCSYICSLRVTIQLWCDKNFTSQFN